MAVYLGREKVKIGLDEQNAYEVGKQDGKQAEYDKFWDNFQNNGNRTHYNYGFSGSGWTNENLKIKYPVTFGSYVNSMFRYCNFAGSTPIDMTENSKKLDFSQSTDVRDYLFGNAYMTNLTVDLSSATSIANLCNSSSNGNKCPISMTIKISENCAGFTNAFAYCVAMQELIFTEDSCIATSISVNRGQYLTPESLKSIIHALKDYSGTDEEYAHTVYFHATALANLEAESTAPTGTTWAEYIDSKGWSM